MHVSPRLVHSPMCRAEDTAVRLQPDGRAAAACRLRLVVLRRGGRSRATEASCTSWTSTSASRALRPRTPRCRLFRSPGHSDTASREGAHPSPRSRPCLAQGQELVRRLPPSPSPSSPPPPPPPPSLPPPPPPPPPLPLPPPPSPPPPPSSSPFPPPLSPPRERRKRSGRERLRARLRGAIVDDDPRALDARIERAIESREQPLERFPIVERRYEHDGHGHIVVSQTSARKGQSRYRSLLASRPACDTDGVASGRVP